MTFASLRGFFVASLFLGPLGCASKPAAPFDAMPQANVTAFRLQNYEPPAGTTPSGGTGTAGGGLIPGLPPEIAQWIQAGAAGLQQFLPPGLALPGAPPAATPTPAPQVAAAPRFPANTTPNFRILSQQVVMDPDLKEDLAKLLGKEGSYQPSSSSCMYAEMGLAWQSGMGAAANELLISFSCNQVQARGFIWPFSATGMEPSTVKKLAELASKIFPPGT